MSDQLPVIDVNIDLGQWPTRRVLLDEPDKLVAKLREHSVIEAWAGGFEGVFHKDITAANNRLAQACADGVPLARPVSASEPRKSLAEPVAPKSSGVRIVPFGEINPLLPDWEAELRRCAETHRMRGVRLHPNYHGYTLDRPEFARLLKAAADKNLIVQLAVIMEDARMMHPLLRVPPVDVAPLAKLVAATPNLHLVLLNALNTIRGDALFRLIDAGEVYCEISMLEGVAGIENLLKEIPVNRILFGSHAPSFYYESAVLKLQESPLPVATLRAIANDNVRGLLPVSK